MQRQLVLPALGICLLASGHYSLADLITNGDFSGNAAGYTTFPGYSGGSNPANPTGWVGVGNTGVNGAGTSTSVFGPASLAGVSDFAFLQNNANTSTLSQSVTFAPNTSYTLTFSGAGRSGYGLNAFGVTVNDGSTNVTNSLTYAATQDKFHNYVVNFNTGSGAGAAPGSVMFTNTTPVAGGDHTFDVSNVALRVSDIPVLLNSGFETANIGTGFHEGVTADNWTHVASASGPATYGGGIVGNGSAYGNANAPEGIEAGLIKADGGMSQNASGFVLGQTYRIAFWAETRNGYGADPLLVSVGDTAVTWGGLSTLSATPGFYTHYVSDPFTVDSTTNLVQLLGTNTNDSAVFIDDVQLPEPTSLSILGLGAVSLLARRRRA